MQAARRRSIENVGVFGSPGKPSHSPAPAPDHDSNPPDRNVFGCLPSLFTQSVSLRWEAAQLFTRVPIISIFGGAHLSHLTFPTFPFPPFQPLRQKGVWVPAQPVYLRWEAVQLFPRASIVSRFCGAHLFFPHLFFPQTKLPTTLSLPFTVFFFTLVLPFPLTTF